MRIELHGARSSLSGLRSKYEYLQRVEYVNSVPKTNNGVTKLYETTIEAQYPPNVTKTRTSTPISTVTVYDGRTETGTTAKIDKS